MLLAEHLSPLARLLRSGSRLSKAFFGIPFGLADALLHGIGLFSRGQLQIPHVDESGVVFQIETGLGAEVAGGGVERGAQGGGSLGRTAQIGRSQVGGQAEQGHGTGGGPSGVEGVGCHEARTSVYRRIEADNLP